MPAFAGAVSDPARSTVSSASSQAPEAELRPREVEHRKLVAGATRDPLGGSNRSPRGLAGLCEPPERRQSDRDVGESDRDVGGGVELA